MTDRGESRMRPMLAGVALVIAAAMSACPEARADCRYGDSLQPERSEIRRPDGERYMCVSGEWIRDKDILAVITVERASLWTDCCGSTDETDYLKAACDQQPACALPATAGWAGAAPASAARRHLRVSYHCAIGGKVLPTSHFAKQAEESAPLTLSCDAFNSRRAVLVTPGFDPRNADLVPAR